ncbi:MAG: hypothetical protein ACI8RZ_002182 [Myxococcota bacterium]|jgi:hypothetical protein
MTARHPSTILSVSLLIHRLIKGPATIEELMAVSGRKKRQVQLILAEAMGVWDIKTAHIPGQSGPGRRSLHYRIEIEGT